MLSVPAEIAAALPQVTLTGFCEIGIDLQKGLRTYSPEEIVVAVSQGNVIISGKELSIRLMNAERIVVTGEIAAVTLQRGGTV